MVHHYLGNRFVALASIANTVAETMEGDQKQGYAASSDWENEV